MANNNKINNHSASPAKLWSPQIPLKRWGNGANLDPKSNPQAHFDVGMAFWKISY